MLTSFLTEQVSISREELPPFDRLLDRIARLELKVWGLQTPLTDLKIDVSSLRGGARRDAIDHEGLFERIA